MSVIKSIKYGVLAIAVVIGAIFYMQITTSKSANKLEVPKKKVFSLAELSKYDGSQLEELYLTVVGNIFDVTIGKKHYMKGSSYHYFVGRFLAAFILNFLIFYTTYIIH